MARSKRSNPAMKPMEYKKEGPEYTSKMGSKEDKIRHMRGAMMKHKAGKK